MIAVMSVYIQSMNLMIHHGRLVKSQTRVSQTDFIGGWDFFVVSLDEFAVFDELVVVFVVELFFFDFEAI